MLENLIPRPRSIRVAILLLLCTPFGGCVAYPVAAPQASPQRQPAASESAADLGIPRAELPPLGTCRVWIPSRSAYQGDAGGCAALRGEVPADGWLVESPRDYPERIRVHVYDGRGEVVQVRLYDARTGRFLREEDR